MRKLAATIAVISFGISPAVAEATGCIRGALAGGVAGHYVGKGHAFAGAAAGCIAAHHYYASKAKQQAALRARVVQPVHAR